jgi:hypothetical protein
MQMQAFLNLTGGNRPSTFTGLSKPQYTEFTISGRIATPAKVDPFENGS